MLLSPHRQSKGRIYSPNYHKMLGLNCNFVCWNNHSLIPHLWQFLVVSTKLIIIITTCFIMKSNLTLHTCLTPCQSTKQFEKTTNISLGITSFWLLWKQIVVKTTITSNQQGPSASQRTNLNVKTTKLSLNILKTCVFHTVNHQYVCRNHIAVSYYTKMFALLSKKKHLQAK